jgi:hypothetical protein
VATALGKLRKVVRIGEAILDTGMPQVLVRNLESLRSRVGTRAQARDQRPADFGRRACVAGDQRRRPNGACPRQ